MSWLVGLAVTVALLSLRRPRGRPVRPVATRPAARGPSGGLAHPSEAVPGGGAPAGLARPARGQRVGDGDLAVLVTDVAGRLRAGADPGGAWQAVLGRPVGPGGPTVHDLAGTAASRPQAAAVVAAGRLAADLGCPLAPLLDGVAEQLAARAEADGERRAALAGPRASARVLTCLPLLGVLLGAAVGADPVAVLLDGALGSAVLAAGVGLVLLGRAWTARLTRHAAAAGLVR